MKTYVTKPSISCTVILLIRVVCPCQYTNGANLLRIVRLLCHFFQLNLFVYSVAVLVHQVSNTVAGSPLVFFPSTFLSVIYLYMNR